MNIVKKTSKASYRFITISLLITLLTGLAAAYNWESIKAFEFDISADTSPKTNDPAFLTIGVCDTAGPIEVEASLVGPGPTAYGTLGAAFAAINAGTHTGAISIEVCGDTNEGTSTATLNASGGSSSYSVVIIRPVGGAARTISGATTAGNPLIDFNGADNVTINGINTGGDSLTISNTTVSASSGTSTIRFIGGATNNTITNSSILGSSSSSVATNGGNIFFSTDTVTANGNDNNTISNNNIGPAGTNLPSKAMLCNGSTGTQAIGNSGLTIDSNNIFDFFAAAVTSSGVAVNGGCNTFSITNNRFYQTGTRTWTTGALHAPIQLNSTTSVSGVQGMTVTGNIIGYASNTQTGTYTLTGSTGSFIGIRLAGITGGTVNNINNNTVASVSLTGVTSSGTSTSSPFIGILANTGVINTNNNTIGSQTATGSLTFSYNSTTATDVYGIYNFSSDVWTSNNNNIGGISVTNAAAGTTTFYIIRGNTGTAVTWTANSNNIGGTVANSISLSSLGTSSQVIGLGATIAPSSFTGNNIRNMTTNIGTGTSTTASMIGINVTGTTPNHTLSQNTISNLSNTNATAASVVTGIQFNGSTANVVERNFIHSLTAATTSTSAEVNGIRVAGGTTVYRNNMIAIGAGIPNAIGTGSTTGGVNGINEPLGTDQFFHNSVYIGGSPTAGVGPSYAFNSSQTTNTRSFRDNIFYNGRSNTGATGKNYIVRVGGTTANPTGLTINNNVYFANGTGAVFGFFNSADVANLAAWKTAVGQDANSFEADPKYLAPAATTPDLHIDPASPTVVEGNGADVGVVLDFDGQTRSGLTPVDIGADAGNFTSAGDIAPPGITYTTLGNTSNTGNRTLNVTVTDNVGVTQVYVYYRVNAGAYSSAACMMTGGTATNGTYSCTISAAVVAGDTVSYFVAASDAAGNVSTNPAGGTGTSASAITTPPAAPNTYTIVGSISGNKTVGAGGDYTTLTAAITALNAAEITGPVTLTLTDPSYSAGETFPLVINANNGSSATNTVTIKPGTGVTSSISGSSAGCIITLNGADYVVLDGSNTAGGTTRDLTVTNTNTGTSSAVICIQNTAAADGATNNTVKNLIVAGNGNTQTLFGIFSGSSTIATTSTGNGNNTNTIQNNSISKTQYGIFSQGLSAAAKNNGTVITQNVINAVAPDNVKRAGILVGFENNIQITQNDIGNMASAVSTEDVFGISFGTTVVSTSTFTGNEVTNAVVTRNKINSVRQTNTYSAVGIFVAPATSGTNLIANNLISGVSANGTSGDFTAGIFIGGGTGSTTRLYYNSAALTGTQAGGSDKSFALAVGGSDPVVDIRNNILYNTQNNGTGNNYAVAYGYSTFNNLTSDYNDYFVGTGATYFVGGTGGISAPTNQATFVNLQTATGKDVNSQNGDPMFVDPTSNLHIATTSTAVYDKGTPVSVLDDFDGQIRSAIGLAGGIPDIGGDEALAPLAANGAISGRVMAADGVGIRNAVITITGGNLTEPRVIKTSAFGYYAVDDLELGSTYVVTVRSKRFAFENQSVVVTLQESIDDLNFQAIP